MIKFEADAIYSYQEIDQQLQGLVGLDTFLKKLGIPRRFNGVILGADVIKALQNPPEIHESTRPEPRNALLPKRSPGRPRKTTQGCPEIPFVASGPFA